MLIVPVEKKIDWKRPPIVLILIVSLNILFFVFYQSGDHDKLMQAVSSYEDGDLLDQEWKAFKAYSRRNDLQYDFDKNDPEALWYIVPDPRFDLFMEKNHRHYIDSDNYKKWRSSRDQVLSFSSKISSNVLGLSSENVKPLQLLSHQFLHGGIMHILGNMVFLILTGFAVEAALGGLRFLGYYLVSGVGAGLLFSILDPSAGTLVGASGSISGVMAMYVMLFGLRKIEFFYWFFIFTGYVRVAAIVMLPFYIGYECYQYFSNEGSNVAYTAHIGGFIAGAVLVFLTQSLNKSGIDESYIDEPQAEADPFAQSLNKLYALIAHCDFKRAWTTLKPLRSKYPEKTILVEIEFNLVRAIHSSKIQDYLLHRMGKGGNSVALTLAQLKAWSSYTEEQKSTVSSDKKAKLLEDALRVGALNSAEELFSEAKSSDLENMELAMLARRIASYCQEHDMHQKKVKYSELASHFAKLDTQKSRDDSLVKADDAVSIKPSIATSDVSEIKPRGVF